VPFDSFNLNEDVQAAQVSYAATPVVKKYTGVLAG
jgi:hypothetical protein